MEVAELVSEEPQARPFRCDWAKCSKSFGRKSDLQRHYKIHTNERAYSCTVPGCGKSFIQRSALTVHNRTHTGEKPHECPFEGCGSRFSDSSSLSRHRRIHTGRRQYKCGYDGCLKSFCRKVTMTKHQYRHHDRDRHNTGLLGDCLSESEMGDDPATPPFASSQARHAMGYNAKVTDLRTQIAFNMRFIHHHSVSNDASAFAASQGSPLVPFYGMSQGNQTSAAGSHMLTGTSGCSQLPSRSFPTLRWLQYQPR